MIPIVIGGIRRQIQGEAVPGPGVGGHPEQKGHQGALLLDQLGGGKGNAALAVLCLHLYAGTGADQIPIAAHGLAAGIGHKLQRRVILQHKPHAGKASIILHIQGNLHRIPRLCLHRFRINLNGACGRRRSLPGKKPRQRQCACGSSQGSARPPESSKSRFDPML